MNDTFGANRANLVGDPNAGGSSLARWFNTNAFEQPGLGVLGNSGRNILRGPTIWNLDFSVFKNFGMGRGTNLQFRLESFNVLNHPQFDGVQTSMTNLDNFGVVNSARPGRINQLGVKIVF